MSKRLTAIPFLASRRLRWAAGGLAALAGIAALAWLALSWQQSRLPDRYNVMDYGVVDVGGAHASAALDGHGDHRGGDRLSVAELTGPRTGRPDYKVTLTAQERTVQLSSGRRIDAFTFNGRVPGPELRVRQHDLVEVTLVNEDVDAGVSIHWHGVDVPNAEDGVAGVTQNAVKPGQRYTYRFRADQPGTFWYHSHQVSAEQVKRGLYGALVVLPRRPLARGTLDLTVLAHRFAGVDALGVSDTLQRRAVAPGTPVRLRLINTDSFQKRFALVGTPFRVAAIDGTDLNAPTPITGRPLELAAGGRYDLAFTMPRTAVKLELLGAPVGLALSRDGRADIRAASLGAAFDPARYGTPRPSIGASGRFDREFTVEIGQRLGFRDGRFGRHWSLNGRVHPDSPVLVVREGDLVKITMTSDTSALHPMHLHGHHMLVLSRNGVPVTGSPWWVDSLDVREGERYELAFRADNPGLWMLHCHNLPHAAEGMTMHLVYEGVTTPFEVGGAAENRPE